MNKWNRVWLQDTGERALKTLLQALVGTSLLMGTTSVDWSNAAAVWSLLGAPTALSVVMSVLANLAGGEKPTASFVGVTSTKS